MIKVLNVISDTNIGGAGRVLLNYLKYADREAFDVSVALPRGSALRERIAALDVPVHEVDGMADKSLDLAAVGKLKKLIRAVGPDIVHTHGSMSGRIAGRQCGKAVVYTRHSVFPVSPRVKKGLGRWLNKTVNEHYADRIIAVSPAAMENLTDGGIAPALIDVVMNGVEPVPPASAEAAAAFRASWGIGEGELVLGILARIEAYKGHNDLLDALKRLRDEGRPVRLLIAGTGAFEAEAKAHAEALGLGDAAVFCGFMKDVSLFLSSIDVQMNASYGTEASSLSLLEGFSLGVPAVVSDYGGNPYLVDEGVDSLVFPTRDTEALAGCVRRLMDEEGLLASLSAGARRSYAGRYTVEIFARRTEEVYRKAWEGKHHG